MRENKPASWKGAALGLAGGAFLALIGQDLAVGAARQRTAAESRIERGRYLVSTHGCNDCHTPMKMGAKGPERDMSRMLSGHPEDMPMPPAPAAKGPWVMMGSATNTAFAGPWGVSYTANLTPDQNTGLGIWTEDMFVRAIRTGKHFGVSRPILPPMPWGAFRKMTDEDLKSIYAYLRTIPPVTNHVPDYEPPAETVAAR
jgi:hypothetical protein